MAQRSSLENSGLLTADPHHLPGYCGHCPQFKFRYGKTFGKMTASLMTDPETATSGQRVLHNTKPDTSLKDSLYDTRSLLVNTRTHSLGDQKVTDHMVPGYCGFVPRSQNYFGTTYSDVCLKSAADLELDYRKYEHNKHQLKFIEDVQRGKVQLDPEQLPEHVGLSPRPLVPIADKPAPYKVGEKILAQDSPYDVNNLDPRKNFISGFTGFVPRSRDLLGAGYPLISNTGLTRFTTEAQKMSNVRNQPIHVHGSLTPPPESKPIYHMNSGMIPKYNGHVPGEKFRHGKTFGESTKEARFSLPEVSS